MDCDWGKRNQDLSTEYGIRGYPTVIFCDSQGKPLERLESRDVTAVAAQMKRIAGGDARGQPREPEAAPILPLSARALEVAKSRSLPIVVLFFDDSPASESVRASLADPILKGVLAKVMLCQAPFTRGEGDCAKLDITRAPTIVVLSPDVRVLAKIAGSRGARELQRDLDAALGGFAPPAAAVAAAKPAERGPIVTKEDEALSDDELDRQFIQAQLVVAREWLRKDRKAKAVEVLEEILKSYPKQLASVEARKLLDTLRGK